MPAKRRRRVPKLKITSIAPAARGSVHAVALLEQLVEQAKSGEILSVVVVSELADGWRFNDSPTSDTMRRIGLAASALNYLHGKAFRR